MIRLLTSTPAVIAGLWTIWGSAFLAIKAGLSQSSPEAFALLRVLSAIAVLLVIVIWRRDSHSGFLGGRGIHRYCIALGATNVAGFLVFQNAGLVEAQVGIASVLVYTQPLLVAIGAVVLLHERLSSRQVLGLMTGWLGVALVVAGELSADLTPAGSALLLLGAAVAWAAGTLVFKSLPSDVSVWSVLLWQNIYGLLPVSLIALWGTSTVTWGVPLLVGVLGAGVGGSIGGFGLQFVLLRRGKASVVSSWIFAVPIIATTLGVLVLGETLHAGLLAGGAAVAVGIYLVNSQGRRAAAGEAEAAAS
ncbi:DMT family transporter [Janibacter sp. GS2]|uniref:DMT family transporter n=1 Tax=Janibacter sp. GS2 TaxID=3442646 RepID=UPI003EBBAAD7